MGTFSSAHAWALWAIFAVRGKGIACVRIYEFLQSQTHANLYCAAVRGLVRRVREGTGALAGKALDAGKVVVFWIAVFAAAKFVLEAS